MYENNNFVTSKLMDSYAWDTICHWFINNDIDIIDCRSWGNFYDSSYKINGLCVKVPYIDDIGFKAPEKYEKMGTDGTFTIPSERSGSHDYYEVATGVKVIGSDGQEIDRNKAQNIYDFAGNMWEWTTETVRDVKNDLRGIMRGGGYMDKCGEGTSFVSSFAWKIEEGSHSYPHIGFRPVLYVK